MSSKQMERVPEYHWSAGECGGQWVNAGHDFNAFLAMVGDDRRDAAIMAEFVNQDGFRATLNPLTLATIGLDRDEVRAIAREHWGLGEHVTMQGSEHASAPASLEHITLESQLDWVQNPPKGIEEC